MPTEIIEAPVVATPAATPVVAPVAIPAPAESAFTKMRGQLTGKPEAKVVAAQAPEKKEVVPVVAKEVTPPKIDAKVVTPPITEPLPDEAKNWTAKTQNRFLELRKADRAAIEAEYQEKFKAVKVLTPEVEEKLTAAEQRALAMESELRQSNIERSPEFKAKFVDEPVKIRAKLSEIAKVSNISDTALITAIEAGRENRRQLSEILSTVDEIDRDDVRELARTLWKIQEDKKQVLTDFETAGKLLDEKRFNDTKAAVEKLVSVRTEALKSTVIPQMETEYASLFEGEEGSTLRSTIVGHIERLNVQNLETMKPGDRAAMVTCAFLAQPLMKTLAARNARIAELEAKLAQEDDAAPKLGGRSEGSPKEEKPRGFF